MSEQSYSLAKIKGYERISKGVGVYSKLKPVGRIVLINLSASIWARQTVTFTSLKTFSRNWRIPYSTLKGTMTRLVDKGFVIRKPSIGRRSFELQPAEDPIAFRKWRAEKLEPFVEKRVKELRTPKWAAAQKRAALDNWSAEKLSKERRRIEAQVRRQAEIEAWRDLKQWSKPSKQAEPAAARPWDAKFADEDIPL